MTLDQVQQKASTCTKCGLSKGRNNVVFGVGNPKAKIMFIGEAPGYHEDLSGEPFVGKAGQLLDELLAEANLSRDDIYIANVLKCRPTQNRDPTAEEIKACTPYLDQQLKLIDPKIIVSLGNFALKFVFRRYGLKAKPITEIHGQIHNFQDLFGSKKIVPLYHPAAALYDEALKPVLVEDFKKLKELL